MTYTVSLFHLVQTDLFIGLFSMPKSCLKCLWVLDYLMYFRRKPAKQKQKTDFFLVGQQIIATIWKSILVPSK